MGNDTRRIVMAMFVAMAVLIGYQLIVNKLLPPRPQPPAPTAAESTPATGPAPSPSTSPSMMAAPGSAPTSGVAASAPVPMFSFTAGEDPNSIPFGGQEGDALLMELNPRGATLATLDFFAKNKKGKFVYLAAATGDTPYQLIAPVEDGERTRYSFATHKLRIEQFNQSWDLADLVWAVAEKSPHQVVFTTQLGTGQPGGELLRVRKVYTLHPGKPVFDLELAVENASAAPLKVRIEQDGPLGIRQESPQYDMRRLLTAQYIDGSVQLNRAHDYNALRTAMVKGEPLNLFNPEKGPFLWAALANKYFAVFTRPLPATGEFQKSIVAAVGLVAAPNEYSDPSDLLKRGDLLARLTTGESEVPPGEAVRYSFEIYAGPKDATHLRETDPLYADKTKLYYQLTQSADTRCFCTFLWLEELMVWLMAKIHFAVRNYGVAIIILVIIVRGLLHPLSVWQQKSMFRMQESMARIQPKTEAIKEKYPNDKVRQNQETMKMWAEEGVNPMSNFASFLPMFIQMPILVALWTALNTDVNLRLAPFDGWWITDLSAPDAFLKFHPAVTVPVLGQIPLIGSVFTNVTSLNLLPLIMGLGMWLQQKYMPKPAMKAKLDAAKAQHAAGKSKSGMSPQDQIRQQQMMAYLMAILLPLMFYKMPSGLNLYWLSTTVFGIGESLLIRKQIDEEKARRAREGPRSLERKPGLLGRFFKHVAAQAEQLQRKADELAKTDGGPKKGGKGKP